jgi:hypothetical protein
MRQLPAKEACILACRAAMSDRLCAADALWISTAENGITFILELLKFWEKQKTLYLFDWEYIAIESRDFLDWLRVNQKWKWNRIPNERIEKAWDEYDQKI